MNLEYLEAEFYSVATNGAGLPDNLTNGIGTKRGARSAAVARPAIDLDASFTAAAMAAGVIKAGQKFDPYENEQNFLLAAFVFEDVGLRLITCGGTSDEETKNYESNTVVFATLIHP